MRFNRKFDAFEDCLYRIQNGASIDQVLEPYPNLTKELRPLLQVAQSMYILGKEMRVEKGAQARSRSRFLSAALEQPESRLKPQPFSFKLPRLAVVAIIIFVTLFLGSMTSAAVSAKSLPGDPLYPIKLATERTRLLLVSNTAHKIKLEQTFDNERLQEVQALIQKTRSTRVNFAGELIEKSENTWLVGDVRVAITPDTQILGNLQPGFYVDVQGILQTDGTVRAYQVSAREYQITGPIQEVTSEQWIVAGVAVQIGAAVQANITPFVGSLVTIHAHLLNNGKLQVYQVDVLAASSGGSTLSAGPAFTETLSPSETPEAKFKAEPTESEDHQIPAVQPSETEDHQKETQVTETEEHDPEVNKSPEPTQEQEPGDKKMPKPTDEKHREEKTPKPGNDNDQGDGGDSEATASPAEITNPSSTPTPVSTVEPTEEDQPHESRTPEPTEKHDD